MSTESTESTELECAHCGAELGEDEGLLWLETSQVYVCHECYYEAVQECPVCGEEVETVSVSEFVLFKTEALGRAMIPGIYRVLGYPWRFASMIGSGFLMEGHLLFIDRLPKWDDQYDLSGELCQDCAKSYEGIWQSFYGGKADKYGQDGNATFNRETTRMNEAIAAHHDLLKDLETDSEDDLDELRERGLKFDGLQTWHDWLLMEYKGVKIYSAYGYDRGRWNWVTVHREPSARAGRKQMFTACQFPTWTPLAKAWEKKHTQRWKVRGVKQVYTPQCDDPEVDRQALIAAIDHGYLDANGPTRKPQTA